MQYVRRVDRERFDTANDRINQWLVDADMGSTNCSVNYIKTPAGSGSPAGLHTHEVDQVFYIVAGTMSIEIDGQTEECGPGSVVFFPKGVPHKNWNAGSEATIHLAIQAPVPDPDRPFSVSVTAG